MNWNSTGKLCDIDAFTEAAKRPLADGEPSPEWVAKVQAYVSTWSLAADWILYGTDRSKFRER